jgi:hypothetical protein
MSRFFTPWSIRLFSFWPLSSVELGFSFFTGALYLYISGFGIFVIMSPSAPFDPNVRG